MLLKVPRDRYAAAAKVSSVVDLESILLVRSSSFSKISPELISRNETRFEFNPTFQYFENEELHLLTVNLALSIANSLNEERTEPQYAISAEFQLRYSLKIPPPPEGIRKFIFESFASISSLHHLWPYWREFVDSTMRRMGVMHFECPMIKFQPDDEKSAASKNLKNDKTNLHSKELTKKKKDPKVIRKTTTTKSK